MVLCDLPPIATHLGQPDFPDVGLTPRGED